MNNKIKYKGEDVSEGEMRECGQDPHFDLQGTSVHNDRKYVLLSFPTWISR